MDLDKAQFRVVNGKTGPRSVPLTPTVSDVLEGIPRLRGNPWVIAGSRPGTHLQRIDRHRARLRARAGLEDVRIHDCRHS